MLTLNEIIEHARNRSYMGGITRDEARVKSTGEVFTPTVLVQEVLDSLPQELFQDPAKTVLDPAVGDGQFLSEVLIRKIENGSTFEEALSTLYGVDLMIDNVDLCRERLLCGQEQFRHIVERNIVCHNGLKYGYSFNKVSDVRRKREEDKIRRKQQRDAQDKRLFGESLT